MPHFHTTLFEITPKIRDDLNKKKQAQNCAEGCEEDNITNSIRSISFLH